MRKNAELSSQISAFLLSAHKTFMTTITHLLDTNIVSYLMRPNPQQDVTQRLAELGPARVAISVISAIELRHGAELSSKPDHYHRLFDVILQSLSVLPITDDIAPLAGQIRAELEQTGRKLSDLDSLIACHAVYAELILVTNDRAFARVPNLTVENCTEAE